MQAQQLRTLPAKDIRQRIRSGEYKSQTAGLGGRTLQANLVILPKDSALDFMRFCQRNPKPCPLVGVTDTGDPVMATLGHDVDIRSDLPAYYVYRNGELAEELTDISGLWADDMVGLALGCSFTFEHALLDAGIPLWNIEHNTTVPMFRTSIQTTQAGAFGGPMVVSMRAFAEENIDRVVEISGRFPNAHGAPVHIGDPAEIGIQDISAPDWGDVAPIENGQVPVFWACGVTPQAAITQAKLPFCITHKPGHMLLTDVPDQAETAILAPQQPAYSSTQRSQISA